MFLSIGIFYFYPKQRQTMKKNLLLLTAVIVVLASCGSKSSAVTATKAEPVESKTPAVAASKAVATDAGKVAYENHCTKCHGLFKPTDFNKEQWAPILVSMQKKAHLSDAEMAPITAYIYAQL